MLYLCPGMKLGGHQLVRRLRDGESRQVFAAVDVSDQRPAVMKIAALQCPEDAGRLEREFIVLREAAGPGVAAALGHTVALPQGMAWLILAAHGPSLASVLATLPQQRLSADMALAAIQSAATALGQLHARGWRHGDLKPGNLLCNADGSIVLSDLEFAGRLSDQRAASVEASARHDAADKTPDLLRAGTPPFVAPELWREGAAAPTTAADLWALGVTLFLCLFGDYPFGYEDNRAIAEAIERGLPEQLAELPGPLRELLKALLAREPAQRPSDGREAARLIADTAQQLGIDLTAARQAFGRLVAAQGEDESPPEPGTVIAAPAAAEAPSAPRASRPEGIGAADSDGGSLSRMRKFLDVASTLDVSSKAVLPPPQPRPPAPLPSPQAPALQLPSTKCFAPVLPAAAAPSTQPAAAPATTLVRRAAARWYRRMNPGRNFPLSVVFSGKEIRIVGGSGLGITLGRQEIVLDPADPVLSVEPWFPGCLISPPRAEVHVTEESTICRFWITPLVCGDLSEACVTIRYRGKVVETLATPAHVVTRTLAKVLAVLGLASPIASKALDAAGWNPVALLRRSLPYAADLLARLGPAGSGLCVAGLLLAAALGYFYVTRPLLSEEREPSLLPQAA
jgi:serine/threonine protein kinase